MIKAYVITDIGDGILGNAFLNKEDAENTIENMGIMALGCEVKEIDYNNEPLDEEGELLKQELFDLYEAKNIIKFHISKGPEYYSLSLKDRIKNLIQMFSFDPRDLKDLGPENTVLDGNLKTLRFDEEFEEETRVRQVDVKEWVKKYE